MADIADSFVSAGSDPQLAALAGDGRPAFLFDRTGTRLAWTNGAGAAWLGARTAAEIAARRFAPEHPTTRRIAALSGQLSAGQARTERIALPKGLIPQPVVCRASRVILGSERLVLLVIADGTGRLSESDAAARYSRLASYGGAQEPAEVPPVLVAADAAPTSAVQTGAADPRPAPAESGRAADPDTAELVESTLAEAAHEAAAAHYAAELAGGVERVLSASGIVAESLADAEQPDDDEIVRPADDEFSASQPLAAAEAPGPDGASEGDGDAPGPAVAGPDDPEAPTDDAGGMPTAEAGETAYGDPAVEAVAAAEADGAHPTPEGAEAPAPAPAGSAFAASDRPSEPEAFSPPTHGRTVRFVFELDGDLRFGFVSDDLAEAVGPAAADVLGRTWPNVAADYALDPLGRVDAALRRRDTFTGLTVDWPVQDAAARMPVDLAGMPVFGRDRAFRGYRGFGIAKTGAIFAAPMIIPPAPDEAADRDTDATGEAFGTAGGAASAAAFADPAAAAAPEDTGRFQDEAVALDDTALPHAALPGAPGDQAGTRDRPSSADDLAGDLAVADAPALVDDVVPLVIADADVAEPAAADDLGTEWAAEDRDFEETPGEAPAGPSGMAAPVVVDSAEPELADMATAVAPALVEDLEPVVIRDEASEADAELPPDGWDLTGDDAGDGLRAHGGVPEGDVRDGDSAAIAREADAGSPPEIDGAPEAGWSGEPEDGLPETDGSADTAPGDRPASEPTELSADMAGGPIPEDGTAAEGWEASLSADEGDPRETPESPPQPTPETEPAPAEQPEQPATPQEAPEEPGVPAEPGPEYPAPSPEPAPEKAPTEAPGDLPPEMPIERPDESPADRPAEEPAGIPAEEPAGMPAEVPGPGSMPSEFATDGETNGAPAVAWGQPAAPDGPDASALSETGEPAGQDASAVGPGPDEPAPGANPDLRDPEPTAMAADVRLGGADDFVLGPGEAGDVAWREPAPQSAEVIPSPIVPRSVPKTEYSAEEADRRQLSRPEREAFQKIAEALGARLEGAPAPAEGFELGGMRFERSGPAVYGNEADEGSDDAADFARSVPPPAAGFAFDAALLDKVPVPLAILKDGEAVSVNRAFLDLTGYPELSDLQAAGGFAEAFAGSALPRDASLPAIRRRDGVEVPVNARLHSIPFGDGVASLMVVQDVAAATGRDRAAAAEQRVEELEAILDTATDGVLVLDIKGVVVGANRSAEALFGTERAGMIGEPLINLLAPESHRGALDYLDGLNRNGLSSLLNDGREVIGRVKQGGLVPLFMTVGRIASGRFCAVLRDITQWKRAEEELTAAKRSAETASSAKSDFLAKISHEIRTPLNAIIGFSEVMMEERFGPVGSERYKEYLRDIHISGAHIMSLVNDLLDLSKIEAGKLDLSFEAVSINDVIRECVALMQPQANRERIIIRTSLSSSLPAVVADNRSLRQIVLNLLSNAIKFNNPGGQVIVSTLYEDTGEVAIRVRDTGPGMSEDDIAKALEPFRQLHTARPGRGTGLGLPLTKALVEANRAGFRIDSAVGQGTLVQITFPSTRVLAE